MSLLFNFQELEAFSWTKWADREKSLSGGMQCAPPPGASGVDLEQRPGPTTPPASSSSSAWEPSTSFTGDDTEDKHGWRTRPLG